MNPRRAPLGGSAPQALSSARTLARSAPQSTGRPPSMLTARDTPRAPPTRAHSTLHGSAGGSPGGAAGKGAVPPLAGSLPTRPPTALRAAARPHPLLAAGGGWRAWARAGGMGGARAASRLAKVAPSGPPGRVHPSPRTKSRPSELTRQPWPRSASGSTTRTCCPVRARIAAVKSAPRSDPTTTKSTSVAGNAAAPASGKLAPRRSALPPLAAVSSSSRAARPASSASSAQSSLAASSASSACLPATSSAPSPSLASLASFARACCCCRCCCEV
mmetsp:Transcript_66631/g.150500  ORF Transcript_66631/g.150500 Transcript_66631/m.150500 type:complete len:274 (-) Transcript_66631:464-1285(-)